MLLQLVTAVGALLGACLSLAAAGVGVDPTTLGLRSDFVLLSPELITTVLLPITAGGFIYIALVSVMPDLLAETPEATANSTGSNNGARKTVWRRMGQAAAEIVALVLGVGLMAAISLFEE